MYVSSCSEEALTLHLQYGLSILTYVVFTQVEVDAMNTIHTSWRRHENICVGIHGKSVYNTHVGPRDVQV